MYCKRKWKRHKRKKRFRQSRAEKIEEENQAYLQLDKYSRGKIEREILDLSQDIKAKKHRRLIERKLYSLGTYYFCTKRMPEYVS